MLSKTDPIPISTRVAPMQLHAADLGRLVACGNAALMRGLLDALEYSYRRNAERMIHRYRPLNQQNAQSAKRDAGHE